MPFVKKYGWKAVTVGLGALAGLATRGVLEFMWKDLRGSPPPKVTADRRSSWVDALSWAVATGVGVGVARLVWRYAQLQWFGRPPFTSHRRNLD